MPLALCYVRAPSSCHDSRGAANVPKLAATEPSTWSVESTKRGSHCRVWIWRRYLSNSSGKVSPKTTIRTSASISRESGSGMGSSSSCRAPARHAPRQAPPSAGSARAWSCLEQAPHSAAD
eukprot:scaffold1124_cov361-Prasinococcus_capsulatus_cf.AAC.19